MPLTLVRNDITLMECDAVAATASRDINAGRGCDLAIYEAAGMEKMLEARRKIGVVEEGKAFITSGFNLPSKYVIHAVSPRYIDGLSGEEARLRDCYRNSLELALEFKLDSIAFPLIATGSFGYPREEALLIAVDEINRFLADHEMQVFLVVFDKDSTAVGKRLYSNIRAQIRASEVRSRMKAEYCGFIASKMPAASVKPAAQSFCVDFTDTERLSECSNSACAEEIKEVPIIADAEKIKEDRCEDSDDYEENPWKFTEFYKDRLKQKIEQRADSFQKYFFYLIKSKRMTNPEVRKRAYLQKQLFSKIVNNPEYHPTKLTALCLCIGAKLNIEEATNLLARAGYTFAPGDITDIIFESFIKHEVYDILEIDILLEEYGEPCIIKSDVC